MELGIIVPLKAKALSKNWALVCENLEKTVRSINAQSDESFHAIVVGHDCPNFLEGKKNIYNQCNFFQYTDFHPPVLTNDPAQNQLLFEVDRVSKILRGIIYLKNKFSTITHWFALDGDDLIRKDFVDVVGQYETADAIILENGYIFFQKSGIVNDEDEFSAYCGSCTILSDRMVQIPDNFDLKSHKKILFGKVSHVHMKNYLVNDGYRVEIPNERIVMYVRENGENISRDFYCNSFTKRFKQNVKMVLKCKLLPSKILSSFSIK